CGRRFFGANVTDLAPPMVGDSVPDPALIYQRPQESGRAAREITPRVTTPGEITSDPVTRNDKSPPLVAGCRSQKR
ncbi:hypothetical protein BaRGS_00025947, partial [Batillaria attramentaria]